MAKKSYSLKQLEQLATENNYNFLSENTKNRITLYKYKQLKDEENIQKNAVSEIKINLLPQQGFVDINILHSVKTIIKKTNKKKKKLNYNIKLKNKKEDHTIEEYTVTKNHVKVENLLNTIDELLENIQTVIFQRENFNFEERKFNGKFTFKKLNSKTKWLSYTKET